MYEFNPPPNGMPVLPADKAEAEKNWRKAVGPEVLDTIPETLRDRMVRMITHHGSNLNRVAAVTGIKQWVLYKFKETNQISQEDKDCLTYFLDEVEAGRDEMPKPAPKGPGLGKPTARKRGVPHRPDPQVLDEPVIITHTMGSEGRIATLENNVAKLKQSMAEVLERTKDRSSEISSSLRNLAVIQNEFDDRMSLLDDQIERVNAVTRHGTPDDQVVHTLRLLFRALGVVHE